MTRVLFSGATTNSGIEATRWSLKTTHNDDFILASMYQKQTATPGAYDNSGMGWCDEQYTELGTANYPNETTTSTPSAKVLNAY